MRHSTRLRTRQSTRSSTRLHSPTGAVRHWSLCAVLVAAGAVACTGKSNAGASGASGTTSAAGVADSAPAATAAGASGASGAVRAAGDSASNAVVTKSAPPTAQDRRVAVPESSPAAGASPADTNRSGMAVKGRGAPKGPR